MRREAKGGVGEERSWERGGAALHKPALSDGNARARQGPLLGVVACLNGIGAGQEACNTQLHGVAHEVIKYPQSSSLLEQ